jgi:quercetin dioxygenase-like cupin family protein
MQLDHRGPTIKTPAENFTGDVWLDAIAVPRDEGWNVMVSKVRFSPGARTAWHSHPRGQTLHVLRGVAWIRTRDGQTVEARAGQTIWCPPGEEHWHGATPHSFMEHLAINDTGGDPATTATWGDHATDEEYTG